MRAYKVETEQGEFTVEEINDVYVNLEYSKGYTKFYEVKSRNDTTVFFLGKGHPEAPKEIVGWYGKSGSMHHSYGESFKEIVNILLRDGWRYA